MIKTTQYIKGFIGRFEDYIYYTDGNDVYKAHKTNVVDCTSGYLIGRWECSLDHFNRFKDVVYSFINESNTK